MKRIILAGVLGLLIALTPMYTAAQQWHTANQVTLAWDAVPYDLDIGERLVYVIYLSNAITDPNKTNPVEVARTESLTVVMTLTTKGSYFVGAKTIVEVEENGNWAAVAESGVGWSDDPEYASGGQPFGIRFYPSPGIPVMRLDVGGGE